MRITAERFYINNIVSLHVFDPKSRKQFTTLHTQRVIYSIYVLAFHVVWVELVGVELTRLGVGDLGEAGLRLGKHFVSRGTLHAKFWEVFRDILLG